MVVIYSSAADKEAAERIAKVLGDRVMLTDQFVLDSVTDTTIVLVGGEMINPNTRFLVDNLYIPGVYAVRDAVGYEPCIITYVKYNNKNVFVVAGWETEHTKWASQVIEFYGGLPSIDYLSNYDQQIIFRYKHNYRQPLVIHFKLYNMPVILEARFKQAVDSQTARKIAEEVSKMLTSKNFIVYSVSLLATQGEYNGIRVSCEVDYQTAIQYYSQVSKSLGAPAGLLIAVAVFLILGGIGVVVHTITRLIETINYWSFTWKVTEVKVDTTTKMLEYCREQGVPYDQCISALQTLLKEFRLPQQQQQQSNLMAQAFTMLLFGLTFAIMVTPIRLIDKLFKRREKS